MHAYRTSNEDPPLRGAHFKVDHTQDDAPSTHKVEEAGTDTANQTLASDTQEEMFVVPPSPDISEEPYFWNPADEFKQMEDATLVEDAIRREGETLHPYVAATTPESKQRSNGESEEINRYFDVNRYRRTGRRRNHMSMLKVAAAVLIVFIMAVGVAVAVYVSDINDRLTHDITSDLRDQLQHSKPGDPFYLLLLGIDKDQGRVADDENYGSSDHAYRSDSIMLCRIDPTKVKITMVSIHRDTLIDMDEYGQQKINAAYAFGGAAYAIEVISEFAGVPISHYAEVDLDRFIEIVGVIGGIEVNLPVRVYDPDYTGLNLPAGKQKLNGLEAALLCRCRHGYDEYGDGDLYRAANQRMVFSEIIKKVMRSDPATIVATITRMADCVTTDMELSYILDLAGQMQSINVDKDIMTGMEPTEGVELGDGWYEVCIKPEWNKMMNRVNKGLSPYAEGEFDSTAGIAAGVGEAGAKAAQAAKAGQPHRREDTKESEQQMDTSKEDPTPAPEPEPEPEYEPEPQYEPEPEYEPEEPVYYEEEW